MTAERTISIRSSYDYITIYDRLKDFAKTLTEPFEVVRYRRSYTYRKWFSLLVVFPIPYYFRKNL